MPAICACADLRTAKKRLLLLSTPGCRAGTAALAGAGPGDVAWVLAANVFSTHGESPIAAFLPELAQEDRMGSASGLGWSFGYLGGMLALGRSLGYLLWAQGQCLPASHFVPVTMLVTASIFGASALVTFALLNEGARPQVRASGEAGLKASLARLPRTRREARSFHNFFALLVRSVADPTGLSVIIALAAV
jgi:UMF1 family MFS transporter